MLILKEMFFGFSSVQFGALKTAEWDLPNIRATLDEYTGNWFQYIEDFIPNQILDRLLTYCRGIEKGLDFAQSDYGKRIESDILWQKRSLFFPFIKMHISGTTKPSLPPKFIKLGVLTQELKDILQATMDQVAAGGLAPAVKNMNAAIKFPIESPVSKRYFKVLNKRGVTANNLQLFKNIHSLVLILSDLVNNPESFWNRALVFPIYRATQDGLLRPIYSLPSLRVNDIIHESEVSEAQKWTSEAADASQTAIREGFSRDLILTLKNMTQEKSHSVAILLALDEPEGGEILFSVVSKMIREDGDHFYKFSSSACGLLLVKISADDSVIIVNTIYQKYYAALKARSQNGAAEGSPPSGEAASGEVLKKLAVGITPLSGEWSSSEALSKARRTLDVAQKRPDPAIVLFDDKRKKYRIFSATGK
jgi:hypothetical protein